MNPRFPLFAPFLFLVVPLLAQQVETPTPPPPVVSAVERPALAQNFPAAPAPLGPNGGQRVYGPSPDTLIARQTADGILENFRRVYKTDHAPRVVIYVNRALVDTATGFKLTGHTEKYYTEAGATKISGENTFATKDAPTPTLADQQTVREIERLFGRAFRNAGGALSTSTVVL